MTSAVVRCGQEWARIIERRLTRFRRALYSLQLFFRFSALGGSAILPLLGAATVMPHFEGRLVLGSLGAAVAFHIFAYLLNDVIDLPVDRTEPRRIDFPLVKGVVQPWQALTLALLQIPLAVAATVWLAPDLRAYAALAVAFILMAAYNVYGKRALFPPVTDAIQGLAWGSLAFYGATVAPGNPTSLTATLIAYIFVFIMLANGVHGSLRDLTNDLRCGVHSTAILLGARPQAATGLAIPRKLSMYAFTLQGILVLLALLPLVLNWFGYSSAQRWVITSAIVIFNLLSLYLHLMATGSPTNREEMLAAGLLQLLLSLSSLVLLFVFFLDRAMLAVLLMVYFLPLLTHSWLYTLIPSIFHRRQIGLARVIGHIPGGRSSVYQVDLGPAQGNEPGT